MKILLQILFLLLITSIVKADVGVDVNSPTIITMPPMPDGPHTQSIRFFVNETTPANTQSGVFTANVVPLEGMSVWTSIKMCMLNTSPDDKLQVHAWITNIDTAQYYFNHEVTSWRGESCSNMEVQENPIHIQHNLTFNITCKNYSGIPVICHARIYLLGK
jgi:hypothetical protein